VLRRFTSILLVVFIATAGRAGTMQKARDIPLDLTELSLEELMDIEITSVSKKEEKLFEAAAAVYVITGEDMSTRQCSPGCSGRHKTFCWRIWIGLR